MISFEQKVPMPANTMTGEVSVSVSPSVLTTTYLSVSFVGLYYKFYLPDAGEGLNWSLSNTDLGVLFSKGMITPNYTSNNYLAKAITVNGTTFSAGTSISASALKNAF